MSGEREAGGPRVAHTMPRRGLVAPHYFSSTSRPQIFQKKIKYGFWNFSRNFILEVFSEIGKC